jgi:zinc protease
MITDIERSRRLNVLASVMRDRMRIKIREELGDAYSPYAQSSTSDTYTDYGYMLGMVESDRGRASKIAAILREIGQELVANGVTEDELERAKAPLMNMLVEYRRNNAYWLQSVLGNSQEYPQRLDWARSIMDDYGNVTVGEVNALAKRYLAEKDALSVLIVSEDGAGAKE